MNKPKLLLVYPVTLPDYGGGSFLPARAVDILKERCRVTLFLTCRPDCDINNTQFCACSGKDGVETVIKKPAPRWLQLLRDCFKPGILIPEARRLARRCDLCVSFANIGYAGKPAIHFVTDATAMDTIGIMGPRYQLWGPPCPAFKDRVRMKGALGLKLVLRFLRLLLRSQWRLRNALIKNGDCVVANSRWIASFFEKENFPVDLIYPPVTVEFPYVSFQERHADFVCIGRIVNLKRIEKMIEILAEVRRQSGREFRFHIAGRFTDSPYPTYIRGIASRHSWIKLHGYLSGAEKENLLTGCRYAIHACEFEAFGISVAEYLKAGCIPFVPNEGGSAEIVGAPEFCYADTDDAVGKILRFLEKDEKEQSEAQARMLERGRLFTLEKFDEAFTALFEEKLAECGFPGVLRGD